MQPHTLYFGWLVADNIACWNAAVPADDDKIVVPRIVHRDGGAGVNAGREHHRLAPGSAQVAVLTGADPLGNFAFERLDAELPHCRRIAAAEVTRASLVVPHRSGEPGRTQTFTVRPQMDHAAALAAVRPLLANCRRLFLGSLTAADADLIGQLLDGFAGETYLMPTADQLAQPERTLDLARQAAYVHLQAGELEQLTGADDVVQGINRLRDAGLSSVIVTAGRDGVYAFTQGRWWHAPAFDVPVHCDLAAGDTVAGAVLAGFSLDRPFDEILTCAAAAAALHVSGRPRAGGWEELQQFAAQARRLPLDGRRERRSRPRRAVRSGPPSRVRRWVYTAAALAVAATSLVSLQAWNAGTLPWT